MRWDIIILSPKKNAHVWVEAFIGGKGWVRFDPTPASLEAFSSGFRHRVQLFLDTINYYWYGIVLTYNLERQLSITRSIITELKRPSLSFGFLKSSMVRYAGLGVVVSALLVALIVLARSCNPREIAVLNRFLRKLKSMGYQKGAHEGLEEFAARIPDTDIRTASYEFVRQFEGIYYLDRPFMNEDLRKLSDIIKGIGNVKIR